MAQVIRVDSPFATPHDTARALGVSASRTNELIAKVRRLTSRVISDATTGKFITEVRAKRKSGATVAKKSSGRNAWTKAHKTEAKRSKARR